MKFTSAPCEACHTELFDPNHLIAFRVRAKKVEIVHLHGEAPWSGIRIVCLSCIHIFRQAIAAIETMSLADPCPPPCPADDAPTCDGRGVMVRAIVRPGAAQAASGAPASPPPSGLADTVD